MRARSEVASASHGQTNGVNQAGTAIQELDRNTQAIAMLIEETTTAANVLADQA